MAEAVRGLASVASAEVDVTLPDQLDVSVHEREPLLIWRTSNGASWSTDGHLAGQPPPADSTLPAVDDQRATAAQRHPATAWTTSTWRRRGCC